ncbi:MAG: N-acetyltransferase [Saprospiraceae bacterium]|nr:N-acetyltransferase [Saprospiraceae bacterium]
MKAFETGKQTIRDVTLGDDVRIFDFVNLYGCTIGHRTKIGTFVEIQEGVVIGPDCKISSHSFICTGVSIGSGVFIGHGVCFVNDKYPRALNKEGRMQTTADWTEEPTVVADHVSIGTNATILPGIQIGEGAIVGAGSVVTKAVPPHTIVAGNPARIIRPVKDH